MGIEVKYTDKREGHTLNINYVYDFDVIPNIR